MPPKPDDDIRRSRKLLQNPYAYLDGDGRLDITSIDHSKLDVHESRRILQNQYAYLDEEGGYSEWPYGNRKVNHTSPLISLRQILPNGKNERAYSRQAIEQIVRKIQRKMWNARSELLPAREKVQPMEVVDPSLALECIGYSVDLSESLGQYAGDSELFEVAGILDTTNKNVQISRRFSLDIRNFTTAHELGHAILHESSGLHRDRALDGAPNSRIRDSKEIEADIFAAYFLMPEKQVKQSFKEIFLTQLFILNEDTAFALTSKDLSSLQNRCRTLRDLTRILASTERYNGVPVRSLATQFKVSTEAMAIRLEELGLVNF